MTYTSHAAQRLRDHHDSRNRRDAVASQEHDQAVAAGHCFLIDQVSGLHSWPPQDLTPRIQSYHLLLDPVALDPVASGSTVLLDPDILSWNQIYRPGSSHVDPSCPVPSPLHAPTLQFHRLVTAATSIQRAFRVFKQRCLRRGWPSQSITRRLLTQV